MALSGPAWRREAQLSLPFRAQNTGKNKHSGWERGREEQVYHSLGEAEDVRFDESRGQRKGTVSQLLQY